MKKKTKVTLQDIANRANLSVSAVSLALRDHPSISEERKKRIHQLRQEMGYRVINSISKAASTNSRGKLSLAYCLIGESLQDEAYAPLAHGIIKGCREWQAQLAIDQLADRGLPSETVLMPTGETPGGYILAGFLSDELVDYFARGNKPVIVLGINPLAHRFSCVRPDLPEAAKMVAERAIADGFRNFVNVTANLTSTHNIEFLQGVRSTLAMHGLSLPDDNVIIAPEFKLHDPKYLDTLAGIATQPTAILTAGERTANTCASILYAKGWIEKLKLGIYALRGSDAGEISPLFKSLNLGMDRMGQIAVDRVVQKILEYETYKEGSITLVSPKGWLDQPSGEPAA